MAAFACAVGVLAVAAAPGAYAQGVLLASKCAPGDALIHNDCVSLADMLQQPLTRRLRGSASASTARAEAKARNLSFIECWANGGVVGLMNNLCRRRSLGDGGRKLQGLVPPVCADGLVYNAAAGKCLAVNGDVSDLLPESRRRQLGVPSVVDSGVVCFDGTWNAATSSCQGTNGRQLFFFGLKPGRRQLADSKDEVPSDDNNVNAAVEDDLEHGCVVGGGYTWCETTQQCQREWEQACPAAVPATSASGGQRRLCGKCSAGQLIAGLTCC